MKTQLNTSKTKFNITMNKLLLSIIALFVAFTATTKAQYITPAGGEDGNDWRQGTTQVITWSKYFMDTNRTVDILLWNATRATYSTIVQNIPVAEQCYMWNIPAEQDTGSYFKVKVVYHNGFLPAFKYVSNDFFSIKERMLQQPQRQHDNSIKNNMLNSIKLYPNPTSNTINVESDNKFFGIELYDISGKMVYSIRFNYTNNYSVNLVAEGVKSGVYQLLVRFMGNQVTEKISVVK